MQVKKLLAEPEALALDQLRAKKKEEEECKRDKKEVKPDLYVQQEGETRIADLLHACRSRRRIRAKTRLTFLP